MQTYVRLWLIDGHPYLTRCAHQWHHGHQWPPVTFHYLCPECGRVWARSGPADAGLATIHDPVRRACPAHAHAGLARLDIPFQEALNESIPMPFLADIFLEHARCFLKRPVS